MSDENTTEQQEQATTAGEAQEAPQVPVEQPTPTPQEDVEDKRIKKLNEEAARYRTERNEARDQIADLNGKYDQLLKGLASLTGQEPEQANPEDAIAAAIAERDAARQELRTMRVTSDVNTAINKAGVDPTLTLAVLKADGTLDQFDPTADDYASQVEAAVSAVAEANPRLRTQVVPKSSGQAPTPTDSGTHRVSREELANMSPADVHRLAAEGKLDHLL